MLESTWAFRHRLPLAGFALALLTLAVFKPALDNGFVSLDDREYVTANPKVQAGLRPEGVKWAFTVVHGANWNPISWLSHMADCQFYGLNPRGHHFTSVLLHALNAWLLFILLVRLTGSFWPSAFAAALFALHPLRVESVAWVAERKDVLSGFFWLLALLAYARYAERPGKGRYLLVALLYCLGLLSKPMVVTFPLVLLLLDYWPLKRAFLLREKLPLLVLSLAAGVVTMIAHREDASDIALLTRLANAFVSYAAYIAKLFWPRPLAPFYLDWDIPGWKLAGAVLLLAALTYAALRSRRSRPYLLVGWLWYLLTLLPVIGVLQQGPQSMADRYTYIPQIGLAIALSFGLADLWKEFLLPKGALAAPALAVLLLCAWTTRTQIAFWKDTPALWTRVLAVNPKAHFVYSNLANDAAKEGTPESAERLYRTALAFQDGNWIYRYNYADFLQKQGRLEEAARQYRKALEAEPAHWQAQTGLAEILERQGKTKEAGWHYEAAARLDPVKASNAAGQALAAKGKPEQAATFFRRALKASPGDPEANTGLAEVLKRQGRPDEAARRYDEALRADPELSAAHIGLGLLLMGRNSLKEAAEHFRAAARAEPAGWVAHDNLGIISARQEHYEDAVAEFRVALKLKPGEPELERNLGVALANVGRLEEARAHLSEAVRLKPDYAEAREKLAVVTQHLGKPSAQ